MTDERTEQFRRSWTANAAAWSSAVREQAIESRRVATDAAILAAVLEQRPQTVLDLGCGEGWLARALGERAHVTGIDASSELVAAARAAGSGTILELSYEELIADPSKAGADFDVVVANFSLFGENLQPLLAALHSLLRAGGLLIVQTLAGGDDGWRTETFASLSGEWPEPMPYYARTRASWERELREGGFEIEETREPRHPESGQPLSIIWIARRR